MGQSWSNFRRKRNAASLQELVPRKTPGHDTPLPKLDRKTLLKALSNVAISINKAKGNVTVIAIGGAVNTIHLQSRDATHDVDFFNDYLTPREFEVLINGARKAADKDKHLDEGWFNNRTIFFIPQDQRQELSREAYQQNEVIFQQPGLTVLAAPWNYAFCCKVDRLAGGGLHSARKYDLSDAVEYLARYLMAAGMPWISMDTAMDWFRRFSLRWTDNNDQAIVRVNATYASRFGVDHDVIR